MAHIELPTDSRPPRATISKIHCSEYTFGHLSKHNVTLDEVLEVAQFPARPDRQTWSPYRGQWQLVAEGTTATGRKLRIMLHPTHEPDEFVLATVVPV